MNELASEGNVSQWQALPVVDLAAAVELLPLGGQAGGARGGRLCEA